MPKATEEKIKRRGKFFLAAPLYGLTLYYKTADGCQA
jgi:hypothetical protein